MTRGGYRPGAGRKPEKKPKDHRVMIRLSDAEYRALWKQAKAEGKALSAWIREVCLIGAEKVNG